MITGKQNTTVLDIVDPPEGIRRCECVNLKRATARKLIPCDPPFYFHIVSAYCERCRQFPFLRESVVQSYGVSAKLGDLDTVSGKVVRSVCEELWPKAKAGEIAQRFEISERTLSNWQNGTTPISGKALAAFKGGITNYTRAEHSRLSLVELIYLDQQ